MGNLDTPLGEPPLITKRIGKQKPIDSQSGGPVKVPGFEDRCSDAPTESVEITETISELAYLTHNYYRYYGKFPSKLGALLISRYGRAGELVFDNYAGSGTTLVEAKLAGLDSVGIDINPGGVLACNVKTRTYNEQELDRRWDSLRHKLSAAINDGRSEAQDRSQSLFAVAGNISTPEVPATRDLGKWFSQTSILELATIKEVLRGIPADEFKEYFVLAFLAIVRRVSKAYDGEVRPHVNPTKKPRPVLKAYVKKVEEMIQRNKQFNLSAKNSAKSNSFLWDATRLDTLPALRDRQPGLVISHPPYLNCFNYIPTFKLDLIWADGFQDLMSFRPAWKYEEIRDTEIISWPATNDQIMHEYFQLNRDVYSKVFQVLKPGGRCCIVIGDATIHKRLVRTHKIFARLCEDIGFELERIIYRTTHYGTGKYAYNDRADYHIEEEGKKDGTLVLRKPI